MASKLLSNEFQKHICLDYECTTIEEAIHKAGDLLVQVGGLYFSRTINNAFLN